jgi:hypothetical protein
VSHASQKGANVRDLHNSIDVAVTLAAASVDAPADGTGIDLSDANAAEVIIALGTIGGTDTPGFTVQVQESDEAAANFTKVADDDLLGGGGEIAVAAANDAQAHTRGYIGNKQYVRVAVTAETGTNPAIPMSAVVVKHRLRHIGTAA